MAAGGNMEHIEFKIFPDGRVEETVKGIKGGECHKVTEKINESLGKVIATAPTEEMYEAELVVEETIKVQNGKESGNSDAVKEGWEGSSSW